KQCIRVTTAVNLYSIIAPASCRAHQQRPLPAAALLIYSALPCPANVPRETFSHDIILHTY
ncbi:hypothetical protein, partial [Ruminococcus sp.]|uniref:hypothetical protein n=1 Tax=Ruminococcus sp. TaxID=41978 RepID=UPI001B41226E